MRRRVPAALIAISLTTLGVLGTTPRTALAQAPSTAERERARSLMDEGDRKREAADLKGALLAYTKADEIMHVPSTMIEVARTQATLGQLLEAKETLARLRALPAKPNEPAPFLAARKTGDALSAEVAARTPSLQVTVEGSAVPAPQVLVDGEPLPPGPSAPRKVNPGRHTIVTRIATGDRSQDVLVLERENKVVSVDVRGLVEPAPAPAPPPPGGASGNRAAAKALVFGGFGLAIVGVGVGAVTGLVSLNKTNDLKPQCPQNVCPRTSQDDIDSANTIGDISTIAFIASGAGAVAGVVGVILAVRSSEPARTTGATWRPVLGASYAGIAGTF